MAATVAATCAATGPGVGVGGMQVKSALYGGVRFSLLYAMVWSDVLHLPPAICCPSHCCQVGVAVGSGASVGPVPHASAASAAAMATSIQAFRIVPLSSESYGGW